MERLVNLIHHWSHDEKRPCPKILIVSPPLVRQTDLHPICEVFPGTWAAEQSKLFRKHYQEVAQLRDCAFLAAEDYTEPGCDGVHITADSHHRLAAALCAKVKELLD